MARRKFSREFKLEAVRLAREPGATAAQIARDLGLHQNVLRSWIKLYESDPTHAFPGGGHLTGARGDRGAEEGSAQAQSGAGHLKKSNGLLRQRIELRYAFVAKHREIWPVSGCARYSMSRRVGFTLGWCGRRACSLRRAAVNEDSKGRNKLNWVSVQAGAAQCGDKGGSERLFLRLLSRSIALQRPVSTSMSDGICVLRRAER
jgi:transposase-like protein